MATLDGGPIDGGGVGTAAGTAGENAVGGGGDTAVGAGGVTGTVAGGGDIGGVGPIKLGATPAAPEEGIGAIPPGDGTVWTHVGHPVADTGAGAAREYAGRAAAGKEGKTR